MAVIKHPKDNTVESAVLYENENEIRQHQNAIEMIALRIGASIEDVERVYEIVLRRFKRLARVKDFLPIIVSRRVEYLLAVRRREGRDGFLYKNGQK